VAATSSLPRQRTVIYIDGFNLYYGALKGTLHKWLNLDRYFALLRPHDDIKTIKYFTAPVDGPARLRQETYLKALATLPRVEVICNESSCGHVGNRLFETVEEKRTDVNMAVSMLDDAYQNACDQFVLISGDSDLVPAVAVIRVRFPTKRVIVYVPHISVTRGYAVELRSAATINRDLPLHLLPRAQFPTNIADGSGGLITKPPTW